VKADARSFTFLSGKCEALQLARANPRKTRWTVVYRRIHRKGAAEEIAKRKTRRTRKFQRGVVGASLEMIKNFRNQKAEVRDAARKAAIEDAKQKTRAKQVVKKQTASKAAASAQRNAPKVKAPKTQKQASKPAAKSR